MELEWDDQKAVINEEKHGVPFHEAGTVFGDPMAITFNNPEHSREEQRFLTFGMSQLNRLLVIAHTDRNGVIRIISARTMTKHERKIYEEE